MITSAKLPSDLLEAFSDQQQQHSSMIEHLVAVYRSESDPSSFCVGCQVCTFMQSSGSGRRYGTCGILIDEALQGVIAQARNLKFGARPEKLFRCNYQILAGAQMPAVPLADCASWTGVGVLQVATKRSATETKDDRKGCKELTQSRSLTLPAKLN